MPPGRRAWMPVKQPPRNTATMQAPSLADLIVDQVRAQGVEGAVSVWFYEAPAQAVAESERIWAGGHAGGGGESPSVCRKLRPRCEGGFEPGVQRAPVCGAASLAA